MFVGGEGCGICPTVLEETGDRGGRKVDAVFLFVSMEGETKHAKQLLIMDVFVFISRTIRYAEYSQTKDESCLLDPRRFRKPWGSFSRENSDTGSSSLVTAKSSSLFYKIRLIFILCTYYLRLCH
jgi:hypothetical protein